MNSETEVLRCVTLRNMNFYVEKLTSTEIQFHCVLNVSFIGIKASSRYIFTKEEVIELWWIFTKP